MLKDACDSGAVKTSRLLLLFVLYCTQLNIPSHYLLE